MRLDDETESTHYEIQSGRGGGFGFPGGGGGRLPIGRSGLGCGGLVLVLVIALALGLDPVALMSGQISTSPTTQQDAPAPDRPPGAQSLTDDQRLTLKVLGSTERRWTDLFARRGMAYEPTTLSFYSDQGQSGCGAAQAAMGPFYCPSDRKIYIDTSFYQELSQRLNAPGDFPIAYVVAHEVGHHIQTITGIAAKVRQQQARASETQANALQVRMELQADCLAGVWAANDTNLMEPGDMEEGLRAAQAIGDDTLQKAARGVVVPESFTHGSAEQRMTWLKRGLQTGDPDQCDTFSGRLR